MASLRATELFKDSKTLLIVIESVDCRQMTTRASYHCYGKIEPIAVIICSSDGIHALDMEAKLIRLEQLRQDIPELDGIIASYSLHFSPGGAVN
jgi:uncharacterized spore protein YtfJ